MFRSISSLPACDSLASGVRRLLAVAIVACLAASASPALAHHVHFSGNNTGGALTPWSGIIHGSKDVVAFSEDGTGLRSWTNEATLVADPPIPAESGSPRLRGSTHAMYELIQAIVDWILSSYYPPDPTALGEVSAYEFDTVVQVTNDAHGIVLLVDAQGLGEAGVLGSLHVTVGEPFGDTMNTYSVTGQMEQVADDEIAITGTVVLPLQDGTDLDLDLVGTCRLPYDSFPWLWPWPSFSWSLDGAFEMIASEPQTWSFTSTYAESAPIVDVADGPAVVSGRLRAAPNPMRSRTTLRYVLDAPASVGLDILDVRGRSVRHLTEGVRPSGAHEIVWDGRADDGREVAPGVYWGRLRTGDRVEGSRRLVLLR